MTELEIPHTSRPAFMTAILVMGLSGIVAEVVLLRELLVVFSGNELVIGVILANWLLVEAVGSVVAGKLGRWLRTGVGFFVAVQLAFAACLPLTVVGVRALRSTVGVPGESFGPGVVFLCSLVLLLPVSITHGALFSTGARIYASLSRRSSGDASDAGAAAIGRLYVLETLGTVAGGVLLSFVLLPLLHSLAIVFAVSLLNCVACVVLCRPWRRRRVLAALSGALAVALAGAMAAGGVARLRRLSLALQWPNLEVVLNLDSIYGNVAVTRNDGQYTFFENGSPVITTPNPDIAFVEEFAHLALLAHPSPRRVLVISGGAGGVLREVLKHGVESVDYCELDPAIIEAVRRCPTPLTREELAGVNVLEMDGRLALGRASKPYDVILLGLSLPADLQSGRFFTTDFFRMARRRLTDTGVLAVNLPGSRTYLEENLAKANLSVLRGLEEVFAGVRVIAGYTNFYLASPDPAVASMPAGVFVQRMQERALTVSNMIPLQVEYRLDEQWTKRLLTELQRVEARPATDFHPRTVFYGLNHWYARHSPRSWRMLRRLSQVGATPIVLLIAAVLGLFAGLRIAAPGASARVGVIAAIFCTGFASMILQLVLIFSYQVVYGYVYHWVALLITAFMVGTAAGGALMVRAFARMRRPVRWLLAVEVSVAAFALALPAAIALLKPLAHSTGAAFLLQAVYLVLSAACGFLVGAQFPLGNRVYLRRSPEVGGTAGLLYGADLMGGWMGGILGGMLLVPLLGLWGACAAVVVFKAVSGTMVAITAGELS